MTDWLADEAAMALQILEAATVEDIALDIGSRRSQTECDPEMLLDALCSDPTMEVDDEGVWRLREVTSDELSEAMRALESGKLPTTLGDVLRSGEVDKRKLLIAARRGRDETLAPVFVAPAAPRHRRKKSRPKHRIGRSRPSWRDLVRALGEECDECGELDGEHQDWCYYAEADEYCEECGEADGDHQVGCSLDEDLAAYYRKTHRRSVEHEDWQRELWGDEGGG